MNKTTFLPDFLIILPAILLLSLGILVLYSSQPQLALQQLIFAIIGLSVYWLLSWIDLESYRPYINPLYLITTVSLLIVFILGVEARGSLRWIQIAGLQFQPSEFAKPAIILMLANFWSTRSPSWKNMF